MGTLLACAARRLNEPAVRSLDTGADWRGLAASLEAGPATAAVPLAIDAPEPLAYAAHAIAALAAGRDLLLCHPHWTAAERAAAEVLRTAPAGQGADLAPPASPVVQGADLAFSPDNPSRAATPRILIATGGSGGVLRFATHSPATLTAAAEALQTFCGGGPLNSLCLLPLHHISGFQQLVRALATGGELALADWRRLAAGNLPVLPTVTGGWMLSLVPTQLARLLDQPAGATWLRGFALILLGGAPAGAALLDCARAERLPLAIAYGASEFAAALAVQPPAEFLAGESGLRPLPGAAVRILNPDTNTPLAAGNLGRIEVASPALFLGYWPEPRLPGPLRTDDLGRLDAAGRLLVVGRADAAINTGGEKVHPAEVEHALRATGAFSEVVVLGLPDPRWGESVAAAFPADDAPDLAAVERTLRATLSPHKLPRRWYPIAAWPRTAQGKTDRAALRRAVDTAP